MAHFEHSSIINAPRAEVYAFVTDLTNLETILPQDYRVLNAPKRMELSKGMEFPIRLSRFGVSVEWKIVVEDFTSNEFYRYRQSQGPYSHWVHTEKFEDHAQGTLITSIVDFELPFGVLGKLAEDLILPGELKRVFDVRQKSLSRQLGKNS